MTKLAIAIAVLALLTACERAADVASRNISQAADNFEVQRRIVFYNGITGQYMLEITGKCSLGNYDSSGEVSITCKYGPSDYRKHYLGLSDNVTYMAEQVEGIGVSEYHTRVMWRPQTIVPDVDFQGSMDELQRNRNTDG